MTVESHSRHFMVVGAGIAGLAAGYCLTELNEELGGGAFRVSVLDAAPRAGGVISTYSRDGITMELGPDSFLTQKPWALELVRDLGLESRLIEPDKKNRRTFVAYQGRLHPLPEGFIMIAPSSVSAILSSQLFSWPGKARMALDLLIPPGPERADESVADFVTRRLGAEALERVAQPMLGGIYTGDPARLSAEATIPRFRKMVEEHGSLIRGLMKSREKGVSGARYGLFATLDGGLELLVDALVSSLPEGSLQTGVKVEAVTRAENGSYRISADDGRSFDASGVILATPAFRSAGLLKSLDRQLAEGLAEIEFASSAVINFVFRRTDISHKLDGFGFVVPHSQGLSTIAGSFHSIKFPDRAPDNLVILRIFVGGELNPEIVDMGDSELEKLVLDELQGLIGLSGQPVRSIVSRYRQAMPQYRVGHLDLVERIERMTGEIPGLALAGNSYRGVGIPDCIRSGREAARVLVEQCLDLRI